jgi:hypothetical protein
MALSVLVTFQLDWAMFLGFGIYFWKAVRDPSSRTGAAWLGAVAAVLGASVIIPFFIALG